MISFYPSALLIFSLLLQKEISISEQGFRKEEWRLRERKEKRERSKWRENGEIRRGKGAALKWKPSQAERVG